MAVLVHGLGVKVRKFPCGGSSVDGESGIVLLRQRHVNFPFVFAALDY